MSSPLSFQDHYQGLLAEHYSWMFGMSFEDKVEQQRQLLLELELKIESVTVAVDLGCGPGFQSLALMNLNCGKVIAIDQSAPLLAELELNREDKNIVIHRGDMRAFPAFLGDEAPDLIVCMGDSLTHLESMIELKKLLADTQRCLKPGGRFVATFRDLSQTLTGTNRIIPVNADDERIMTCLLDYEEEAVVVTDIIYRRQKQGWALHKSSYRKLRLSQSLVVSHIEETGFVLRFNEKRSGMVTLVAEKSA